MNNAVIANTSIFIAVVMSAIVGTIYVAAFVLDWFTSFISGNPMVFF